MRRKSRWRLWKKNNGCRFAVPGSENSIKLQYFQVEAREAGAAGVKDFKDQACVDRKIGRIEAHAIDAFIVGLVRRNSDQLDIRGRKFGHLQSAKNLQSEFQSQEEFVHRLMRFDFVLGDSDEVIGKSGGGDAKIQRSGIGLHFASIGAHYAGKVRHTGDVESVERLIFRGGQQVHGFFQLQNADGI